MAENTKPEEACQNFEAAEKGDLRANGYMEMQRKTPVEIKDPKKSKRWLPSWKNIVCVLILGGTVLLGLLIGYYISKDRHASQSCGTCTSTKPPATLEKLDPRNLNSLHESAMYAISGERIATTLKDFRRQQVFSGTKSDKGLIQMIEGYFDKFGFLQQAKEFNDAYNITVSLPEKSRPNSVTLISTADGTVAKMEPDLIKMKEQLDAGELVIPDIEYEAPFVDLSPAGNAQGELVYLHYGRHEDFMLARKTKGIPLKNRIALIRLGEGYVQDKVREAQDNGMSSVLLYNDPQDSKDMVPWCSPDAPFLSTNDKSNGDPATPGYPSSMGMQRMTVHEASIATIPSQPISCQMAEAVMQMSSGQKAPKSWRGGLNATYYIGRKTASQATATSYLMSFLYESQIPDSIVRVDVNNRYQDVPIRNVIGKIRGYQDPDHYVIIGASRTSYANEDDSGAPGTGLLLEIATSLYLLAEREQWVPKRTILLASWGGEEYASAGKAEFIEEYKEVLAGRTVAYIDLDHPVNGNYSLEVVTSSVIREVIYNAAQRVPSPDNSQGTTFNSWLSRSDELTSDLQPKVTDPYKVMESGQGDPFYTELGIPTAHVQYAPNRLNATILDLTIMSRIEDLRQWSSTWEAKHHYRHYTNIGRLVTLITLSLADAAYLQFDIKRSSAWLQKRISSMGSREAKGPIEEAAKELKKATASMDHFIKNAATFESVYQRRLINERLMQCEHLIIKCARHLYDLKQHLLGELSPSRKLKKESSKNPKFSVMTNELSQILHYVRSATQTLKIQV